jgi:hypothetical protein
MWTTTDGQSIDMVDCRRGNDDGSVDRESVGTGAEVVVTIIVAGLDLVHRRPLLLELLPLEPLVLILFFRVGGGTTTGEFLSALKGGGAS